jgi:hypothetical protein
MWDVTTINGTLTIECSSEDIKANTVEVFVTAPNLEGGTRILCPVN